MWGKLPNHLFMSSPKPKFTFIFSTCGIICSFKKKKKQKGMSFFLKKKIQAERHGGHEKFIKVPWQSHISCENLNLSSLNYHYQKKGMGGWELQDSMEKAQSELP